MNRGDECNVLVTTNLAVSLFFFFFPSLFIVYPWAQFTLLHIRIAYKKDVLHICETHLGTIVCNVRRIIVVGCRITNAKSTSPNVWSQKLCYICVCRIVFLGQDSVFPSHCCSYLLHLSILSIHYYDCSSFFQEKKRKYIFSKLTFLVTLLQ